MATHDLHQAALVLLSLPYAQRTLLLDRLDPRQAEAVTAEMNAIDGSGADEQESAAHAFLAACDACNDSTAPAGSASFDFLHDLDVDTLLGIVATEHPQAVALILSRLNPQQAAAVLAELPPDEQLSIICRIATLNEPSREVVEDVACGLKRRLSGPSERPRASSGVSSVIRILDAMRPADERKLLDGLSQSDPELVRAIRRVMFGDDRPIDCETRSVRGAAC